MTIKEIKELDKDKVLAMIGLQVAASTTAKILSTAALFAVGAVVGAGVALLWAPKPGKVLRRAIRRKLRNGTDELSDLLPDRFESQSSGI